MLCPGLGRKALLGRHDPLVWPLEEMRDGGACHGDIIIGGNKQTKIEDDLALGFDE